MSLRNKERYASDPEYRERIKSAAFKNRLMRHYGLTVEEHAALIRETNGLCSCCGKAMVLEGRVSSNRAVVDHCHTTGVIRGIICNGCNRGIGYFGDDPQALRDAAAYIERFSPP